jgi:hypothetical protein
LIVEIANLAGQDAGRHMIGLPISNLLLVILSLSKDLTPPALHDPAGLVSPMPGYCFQVYQLRFLPRQGSVQYLLY